MDEDYANLRVKLLKQEAAMFMVQFFFAGFCCGGIVASQWENIVHFLGI